MQEREVFIPTIYPELKNKYSKFNLICYMADKSVYDKEKNKRIIMKKDIPIAELAKKKGTDSVRVEENKKRKIENKEIRLFGSKATIYRDLKLMTESEHRSFLLKDEGDSYIFLNDIQDRDENGKEMSRKAFTVSLPHTTLKTMYNNCNNITIKLFLYLYRQHHYWTQVQGRKGFGFTISYLCEELGLAKNNQSSRQKIMYAISTLESLGFLRLGIKEKKNYKSYFTKAVYTRPMNVEMKTLEKRQRDNQYKEPTQQQAQQMADDDDVLEESNPDLFTYIHEGEEGVWTLEQLCSRLSAGTLAKEDAKNKLLFGKDNPKNKSFIMKNKRKLNEKLAYLGAKI